MPSYTDYQYSPYSGINSALGAQNSGNTWNDQFQTGWLSALTGGEKEKASNVAMAEVDRQFQAQQALLGRQFSSSEAQRAREWQQMMSSSAYQRAVVDMRKAGLNPALALMGQGGFGGASAGTAPAASAGSTPSGSRSQSPYNSAQPLATLISTIIGATGFAINSATKAVRTKKVRDFTKRTGLPSFMK